MTNTKKLIKYCDSEITSEIEKLLGANQEQISHNEMRIDIYREAIYFLRENETNEDTDWLQSEHEKLIRAIKKVVKLNTISFMEGKINILRDRVIFKNESIDED